MKLFALQTKQESGNRSGAKSLCVLISFYPTFFCHVIIKIDAEESLAGGLFSRYNGVIFVKGHERPLFEHVVVFVVELMPK